MKTIHLNHFALSKPVYRQRLSEGFYKSAYSGLSYEAVPQPDIHTFMTCIWRMNPDLDWDKQAKMYNPELLQEKLRAPETVLYLLKDGDKEVGFALQKASPTLIRQRFFDAANDNEGHVPERVIELDYLGLFKGQEGGGRGKAFFELLFADLFKTYDHVYWSQHSTNAPTLEAFYRDKMGMEFLGRDEIPDFRIG